MTIQFDEKGKFYTEIVPKDPVQSIIQTTTHRIEGNVYIKRGERLIDELKSSGQFIAITDARISLPQGEILYNPDFLSVNKDHIIWIIPHEDKDNEILNSGGQS